MTEEQVIFYVIGKCATYGAVAFAASWTLVSTVQALGNASTVLADKARKIRAGKK